MKACQQPREHQSNETEPRTPAQRNWPEQVLLGHSVSFQAIRSLFEGHASAGFPPSPPLSHPQAKLTEGSGVLSCAPAVGSPLSAAPSQPSRSSFSWVTPCPGGRGPGEVDRSMPTSAPSSVTRITSWVENKTVFNTL